MWKQILVYSLLGLGFLTITFFRKYTGKIIPHPFLFYLLGCALLFICYLILRRSKSTEDINRRKQLAEIINDLKTNGEKIQVDLTQCEIKEHNYTEEREKEQSGNLLTADLEQQIQSWDAISGNAIRNVVQVHVKQTIIIYRYNNQRSGEVEKFVSRVLPKDKVTLSFYLDSQQQTFLYVDRTNRRRYYFDLDFLNDEN